MDALNVHDSGLSYSTSQVDRLKPLKQLALRASIAALVLAGPPGLPDFLFLDLDVRDGRVKNHILFPLLLHVGYVVAGVVGYTANGFEVEVADGYAEVMTRARESFVVDVVLKLNQEKYPCT